MTETLRAVETDLPSSSWLDVSIFIGTFIAGLTAYFTLRHFGAPQWLVTGAMLALMVGYAVLIYRLPRLRLRLDQTGDNSYYLGLLFTLVSMAAALRAFGLTDLSASDDSSARQIIAEFGIALATTIMGIFLRVVLHQMRVDPAQIEAIARLELTDAATRVRGVLDNVSIEMERLIADVRQRAEDSLSSMLEDSGRVFEGFVSQVSGDTERLTAAISEAHNGAVSQMTEVSRKMLKVADSAEAAAARLHAIEPPPAALANRLQRVSETLAKVAENTDSIGLKMANLAQVSFETSQHMGSAATLIKEAAAAASAQQVATAERLEESTTALSRSLEALGKQLDEDRGKWVALDAQVRSSADSAKQASEASTLVLDNFVQVTRELTEAIRAKL